MSARPDRSARTADEDVVHDLEARLAQYPSNRYPAQHATSAFHLGTHYLQQGRVAEGLSLMTSAHDLFGRIGMVLEQAKALMMSGVAHREVGEFERARACFSDAAETFGELEQYAEQGAATYNQSLALTALGRSADAWTAMTHAADLLASSGQLAQAAVVYREQGSTLLRTDQADQAVPLLERSVEVARRAGDLPALGAASNVLGLARLAVNDPGGAVQALHEAVGAYPRTLRPHEHAMAKANLALAHEQDANPARARLAARQVESLPHLDPQVSTQVQGILRRLRGSKGSDLFAVLDQEGPDQWPAVIREETTRWSLGGADARNRGMTRFLLGLLERPADSYALAEGLLGVVLEMPPDTYGEMIKALVLAASQLDEEARSRVSSVFASALARFAMPQWQRTVAALNAASVEIGQPASWR